MTIDSYIFIEITLKELFISEMHLFLRNNIALRSKHLKYMSQISLIVN